MTIDLHDTGQIRRHPRNPILTRADIPAVSPILRDVTSVFNPGAVRVGERYLLLLRVQTRGRETVLMLAESADGVAFRVQPRCLAIEGLEALGMRIFHVYDPRLTRLDDAVYCVFCVDTEAGSRLGVARMTGAAGEERLELVGFDYETDSRNGVLFPQRFGGRYLRLERPNMKALASGVRTGDTIHLSESDDLVEWRLQGPIMEGRWHYWDEWIGPGPPPIKTTEGWLLVYHGVATHLTSGIYQAGVCLLDLDDPARVIARGRNNILEPRELYETVGQVPNVVFPSGMIVEPLDGDSAPAESRVLIYYGCADTAVAVAETTVGWLLEQCRVG